MPYERYSGDNITFWKVDHQPTKNGFTNSEWKSAIEQRVIMVNGRSNIERLTAMKRGDYFYLCHGNIRGNTQGGIKLIGRIVDYKPESSSIKRGWSQRHYEMLFPKNGEPLMGKFYDGEEKSYAPGIFGKGNHEPICEINKEQASEFENDILWSCFEAELSDFGGLWGLKRSANISQAFLNALTSPPPPPKPTGPGCSLFAVSSQNIILAVELDKHMLRFINSHMHQEFSICPCR